MNKDIEEFLKEKKYHPEFLDKDDEMEEFMTGEIIEEDFDIIGLGCFKEKIKPSQE